jgi:hypothetical protein
MSALTKIRNAGFQIEVDNDDLLIEQGDKLTDNQLTFLKTHKAEILNELKSEQVAGTIIKKFVTCWTPNGSAIEVQAKNAEHAAWLIRMNPEPKEGIER